MRRNYGQLFTPRYERNTFLDTYGMIHLFGAYYFRYGYFAHASYLIFRMRVYIIKVQA